MELQALGLRRATDRIIIRAGSLGNPAGVPGLALSRVVLLPLAD
ncbi:hypothetical protein [Rathayibacter iranicus]|nr:hypothetical protein [Rathayibacter iranicus]